MDVLSFQRLQEQLGYRFRDETLLTLALTHPSLLQDSPSILQSNERLEFLGDSVLNLVMAETLYRRFLDEPEGMLTRCRSALVKSHVLFAVAEASGLESALRLGRAEINSGERGRQSRLENALEALLGAVYLDGGLDAARAVIARLFGDLETRLAALLTGHNAKGRLQEWVQAHGGSVADIVYQLDSVSGPDHARTYAITVLLRGAPAGSGAGTSRKSAEGHAAAAALERLETNPAGFPFAP